MRPPQTFLVSLLAAALAVVWFGAFGVGCEISVTVGQYPPPIEDLELSSDALHFGQIEAGTSHELSLTVTNRSRVAITLDALPLDGHAAFSWTGLDDPDATILAKGDADDDSDPPPVRLPPNESYTLSYRYSPLDHSPARASLILKIKEHPATEIVVPLVGNPGGPCLKVDTPEVDFHCQLEGTTTIATATVTSCSGAPRVWQPVFYKESSSSFYAESFSVEPGESVEVPIVYQPKTDSGGGQTGLVWELGLLGFESEGWPAPGKVNVRGFAKKKVCTGLVVELSWVTPNDQDPDDLGIEAMADLDVHFRHIQAEDWFDVPYDANYFNPSPPYWGPHADTEYNAPEVAADHYFDAQLRNRETVVLEEPQLFLESGGQPELAVKYTLGAHYWRDHDHGHSMARVRAWAFGQLVLDVEAQLLERDMWEVATFHWPAVPDPTGDRGVVVTVKGVAAIEHNYQPPPCQGAPKHCGD